MLIVYVNPHDGDGGDGEAPENAAGRVKEVHADRPREGNSPGPREPGDMNRVNLVHDIDAILDDADEVARIDRELSAGAPS